MYMKKTLVYTLFLLSFVVAACGKDAIKRSKVYKSGNVAITFRDFTDSRCPTNANCIHAGEATVSLTITGGKESLDFVLRGIGADTVLLSHRIVFVDLLPYPESGVAVDPGDKELKLNVTKL